MGLDGSNKKLGREERSFVFVIQFKFKFQTKIKEHWGPNGVYFKCRDSPYVVHSRCRDCPYILYFIHIDTSLEEN